MYGGKITEDLNACVMYSRLVFSTISYGLIKLLNCLVLLV